MLELNDEVVDHLRRHHGVISVARLMAAGYSRTAVDKLQRHGLLVEVLQGAYRLRGMPVTFLGLCAAVCTAHPHLSIAGPSAGQLWGFRRLPIEARVVEDGALLERVHVIGPPGARPTVKRWVSVYRTNAIHDRDVVQRDDGVRLTDRPRTVLDLARFVQPIDLLSIAEQAMRDGGHTPSELRATAVDWRSPRRRWLETYLQVLDRILPGGAAESHPEVQLGDALVRAGVTGLVRQFEVHLPGYGAARFDLAVPSAQTAIEIDAFPTHQEIAGRARDQRRDRACAELGWTVIRVTPGQLGRRLPHTVAQLTTLLGGTPSSLR